MTANNQSKFFVYAVYNKECNKFYIGQTDNLKMRVEAHNDGRFKTSYTSRFKGIWYLLYAEEVADRIAALKREKQLKSYQGRLFIKKLIESFPDSSPPAGGGRASSDDI